MGAGGATWLACGVNSCGGSSSSLQNPLILTSFAQSMSSWLKHQNGDCGAGDGGRDVTGEREATLN